MKNNERLYYLDWLRVLAFGLLFIFHSARFFDDYGWHLKNEEHSMLANILVGFTHGWRMHLIFFISGVGTYFALKSRKGAFIKDRFTRLIVPYLFGIVLLVPPQKYYEFLQNNWFTGQFSEFIMGYPTGLMEHHPGATLEWTGHLGLHIWYLAFLFVMTLVYLPLVKAISKPNFLSKSLKFFSRNLMGLFVFILPVILTEVWLRPTHGDYLSWADFFQYSMFFLVGYFFMVFDNYRSLVKKYTYLFLALGAASSWYIFTRYPEINQGETMLITLINAGIRITSSYSWVLFFFGLSQRKLNFNSRYLSRLNTGILPFYILHQTVIIVIGFYVVSTNLGILTKFLIILTTSLISTILLYQIIKRVNALRFVFGMKILNRK
ncbi:acyltransferase family protein [Maribellus sediminis]|uniref:acyltransferase family protein n=1 Tax=Maribellus sediminis TaxID=2696285 RepID=UPI00142F8A39|nr:acyltransferase family protein [Maribellus sediminis]